MADDTHDGPGAIPQGVDSFTLLAEGFFPTHAPRTTESHEPGKALLDAFRKSCAATSTWEPAALLAQPPVETRPASIRTPPKAAAGLPAIISVSSRRSAPWPARHEEGLPQRQPEGRLRLPELRLALTRREAPPVRVL
jgi:hypothetical protein